ncbi:MAG: oxyanion-translocating ATPase [Actinomycetia bacterium]|nr:oxyanion-translocating ATPase [Actinomycetes bacterium]
MTVTATSERALDQLVDQRRVVICCGSGGVGKTTTAAVVALEGARRGRNAVVVTIDPAKRLANALGLDHLSDTATEIDRSRWDPNGDAPPSGRLSALMLDTKSTFDRLITRNAGSDDQAQGILENRFYRNVSGALGGTQEYMAMEKLHELHEEGGFDLIVVDTPPTRHALDFLDAPKRLIRLLDNRIFRLLMMPTRAYLRVASVAVQAFLRTVSRVIGTEVVEDVVAFFRAFEGMEQGFRDRARAVEALISDPSTAFVLVTSPRRDAVDEARYFAQSLTAHHQTVEALIVNRVHPAFGDEAPEGLRARAEGLRSDTRDPEAAARLAALYENLADFRDIAIGERTHLESLRDRIGSATVAYVPFLAHDVYDFDALGEVANLLFVASDNAG